MTEQRFEYTAYEDGTASIYDKLTDEYYFDMELSKLEEEVLSKLHDENEQFKEALIELKEIGDYQGAMIQELDTENQQLIKENKTLLKHCENHGIIVPLNYERYKKYVGDIE